MHRDLLSPTQVAWLLVQSLKPLWTEASRLYVYFYGVLEYSSFFYNLSSPYSEGFLKIFLMLVCGSLHFFSRIRVVSDFFAYFWDTSHNKLPSLALIRGEVHSLLEIDMFCGNSYINCKESIILFLKYYLLLFYIMTLFFPPPLLLSSCSTSTLPLTIHYCLTSIQKRGGDFYKI